MARAIPISRISRCSFSGAVYNLELEGKEPGRDDLFWIERNTMIVTHNCLPKDLANLITHLDEEHLVTRAAYYRNLIDRERKTQPCP